MYNVATINPIALPTNMENTSIVDTVKMAIDKYVNNINELGHNIKDAAYAHNLLDLQNAIGKYSTQLELGAKVVNSTVKAVNSLVTSQ